jgi:hypothetical protein
MLNLQNVGERLTFVELGGGFNIGSGIRNRRKMKRGKSKGQRKKKRGKRKG